MKNINVQERKIPLHRDKCNLIKRSRTITGRGRGFWNVEEGGALGKEVKATSEAPGRSLIRDWQP